MKETPLSTVERNFITQAVKQNLRLDGRKNDEFRNVTINFGADWGSALVSLGETKVLAQVSCELGVPKSTRPNEGMIYINVELGQMAAPHFESGRNSELNVQISRTLERTFKDSRCVDLESLCVTTEERVWVLRIDLNVLNHEGNLIDCCSVAALSALMHFKRPDVSIIDNDVHIHSAAEKEPIPMVLHHYPVCVSYCLFDDGRLAVADPSVSEERTAESAMVFGLNSFRELCCLNLGGTTLTSSTLLLQCATRAARRAKFVVDYVKETLELDVMAREDNKNSGFTECVRLNKITALAENRLALRLRNFKFQETLEVKEENAMETSGDEDGDSDEDGPKKQKIVSIDAKSAVLESNQSNIKWVPEDDGADSNVESMSSENVTEEGEESERSLSQQVEKEMWKNAKKESKRSLSKKHLQHVDSDSEEETKVIL
ncbi:PREDICTED: exosome complex component rrp45 isoform X2 [Rhagoletis zephyria]|uniref:exosome complex component rrp45 isoform X2 n=1 Tax=Rhagoletis zephyria TaxID=28612 RepID=UPI0008117826|nr:PREDICTED: exosome complex component rrp45 isoform X2 [Rhagoletis zephyria]